MNHSLHPQYNAKNIEENIYQFWQFHNFFACQDQSSKPTFCIMLPPPNVTGYLHLGHALDHVIQDVLIRWKRMSGFNTLWQPGLDHAGIATQSVVERELDKQGLKAKDIGRSKFLEYAWSWKDKYSRRIISQMKRLGDSCDWQKNRFTLDEGFSQAVRKVFVTLYKEGFIYQDQKLVNWDTKLESAISDLEVEHEQRKVFLWHFKYMLADHDEEYLQVATTRLETMLGDTAVCVHPEDERYKKYIGRKVIHPFLNRQLPIIADDFVDPKFGSGVVKITPAHDFTDYEVGKRHQLEFINILNPNGTFNQNAGPYEGLTPAQATDKVLADLNQKGLMVLQEDYTTTVPVSQRSGEIIEPFLSKQWFVKSSLMTDQAKKVIENKSMSFEPELWTNTYLHWMNQLQDWCISRQLWWGHQIPAWFCRDCKEVSVSEITPKKCHHCSSQNIYQEKDVLDTWFSSALWPFATLGWPKETKELKTFYPTDVLVTGHDIIFFWVGRMVMAGLHHLKKVPFKKVYIHGIIRDSKGKKMSKSLGNTLDPIELIDEYGADALRLALLSQVSGGRDLKFSKKSLEVYRNFLNKLWNAARFALSFLEEKNNSDISLLDESCLENLHSVDQWMIYKLGLLEEAVDDKLKKFKFSEVTSLLYDFVWHDFCDWYLEFIKLIVYNKDDPKRSYTLSVLFIMLNRISRLLHPLIPFVTEEIYQKLPIKNQACIVDAFPHSQNDQKLLQLGSKQAAFEMDLIRKVITAIRNIRGENNISPSKTFPVKLIPEDRDCQKILETHQSFILRLARVSHCQISLEMPPLAKTAACLIQTDHVKAQVIIPLTGLVDFDEEIKRLEKNIHKIHTQIQKISKHLNNPDFIKNAPDQVVIEHQDKLKSLKVQQTHLENSLARFK